MSSNRGQALVEYDLKGLQDFLDSLGVERYRAWQIFEWLYGRGVTAFEKMSNVPVKVGELLRRHGVASLESVVVRQVRAKDATEKCTVRLGDGNVIEFVVIRHGRRNTLCVSTQVGCAVGCVFCASGARGFVRNLTPGEIAGQYVHALGVLFDGERISNIVVMGMGEPMLNLASVLDAIERLHAPWGANIGLNRITISTVGYVEGIRRLAASGLATNLAISLHAPSDELLRRLVPHGPRVSVRDLVAAGTEYRRTTGKDVSVEYVIIGGVNGHPTLARALARLLRGTGIKVNIIPFNPWRHDEPQRADLFPARLRAAPEPPGRSAEKRRITRAESDAVVLKRPTFAEVAAFHHELERRGIPATVRASRGCDIAAACGQLALHNQ